MTITKALKVKVELTELNITRPAILKFTLIIEVTAKIWNEITNDQCESAFKFNCIKAVKKKVILINGNDN